MLETLFLASWFWHLRKHKLPSVSAPHTDLYKIDRKALQCRICTRIKRTTKEKEASSDGRLVFLVGFLLLSSLVLRHRQNFLELVVDFHPVSAMNLSWSKSRE